MRMLEFYPEPTVPGTNLVSNFTRNAQSPTDSTQFNQRIDWIESTKSSWFGRYSWGDELQIPASVFLTDSLQVATKVQQAVP